jgi:hypothetical protein
LADEYSRLFSAWCPRHFISLSILHDCMLPIDAIFAYYLSCLSIPPGVCTDL